MPSHYRLFLIKMNNFTEITSRENQKLKFARAVRDGREDDWIFVEGLRLCEEILKTELPIQTVFITEEFLQTTRAVEFIEQIWNRTTEITKVDEKIFTSLADTKTSQGIVIIAQKPLSGKAIIEQNLSQIPLLLLLHKLNNPSNLGAILRTAEAVGVEGIITTKGTVDVFSAKATRGAMGANLRLPFWTNAEFNEVIEWAYQYKIKSVCADIRSEKSYLEIDWNIPRLLVLGSEGHGLSSDEREQMDESLIIPMANGVESLNVAVASGVILFEAKRQKSKK